MSPPRSCSIPLMFLTTRFRFHVPTLLASCNVSEPANKGPLRNTSRDGAEYLFSHHSQYRLQTLTMSPLKLLTDMWFAFGWIYIMNQRDQGTDTHGHQWEWETAKLAHAQKRVVYSLFHL